MANGTKGSPTDFHHPQIQQTLNIQTAPTPPPRLPFIKQGHTQAMHPTEALTHAPPSIQQPTQRIRMVRPPQQPCQPHQYAKPYRHPRSPVHIHHSLVSAVTASITMAMTSAASLRSN